MGIIKVIMEDVSLYNFEAWRGGKDGKQELIDRGLITQFEDYVNLMYPEGLKEEELNDILWLDMDNFYETYLGYAQDKGGNWVDPNSIEEDDEEDL